MEVTLDWSKVTGDKRFQRLINDLFAFETNYLQCIPSSPDIGADGGLDGIINVRIPFLKISGRTALQAKSIQMHKQKRQVRSTMKSYLLGTPKSKGEMQKALDKGCKNLILATNGKLGIDYIEELENLKLKDLNRLVVLDRERLQQRIILYKFICMYYFEEKIHPTFIPPNIYFEKQEALLGKKFIDRTKFDLEFNLFIKDKKKSIFYLFSPGGFGKSHLLNYISSKAHTRGKRKVLLVDNNHRPFSKALEEEIIETTKERYLLIFDDIDRNLPAFELLLKLMTSSSYIDIKIVITSRTSSKYIIKNIIHKNRLSGKTSIMKIPKWKEKDLIKLFKSYNDSTQKEKIDYIVRKYSNPYLISWVARKMKGKELDIKELHDRLIGDLNIEVSNAIKSLNIDDQYLNEFLFNILCIIPFSIKDEAILEKVSQRCGIDMIQIKDLLERLIETKVFREIGGVLRVNPDLKGDIYLQYIISQRGQADIVDTFNYWVTDFTHNLMFNINSASYYGSIDKLTNSLERQAKEWVHLINNNAKLDIQKILKLSNYMVSIIPATIGTLLETLIQNSNYRVTTDDVAPLIRLMYATPDSNNVSLNIIMRMYSNLKEGFYDNNKLDSMADFLLNPLKHSAKRINQTLRYFASHTTTNQGLLIALNSLQSLLRSSHNYSENYGITVSWGTKYLKRNKTIVSLREEGIKLLKSFIDKIDNNNLSILLDTIKSIGTSVGITKVNDAPLYDQFRKEQKEIITYITSKPMDDISLENKTLYESFLIWWWATEKEGADISLKALRNEERSLLQITLITIKDKYNIGINIDSFIQNVLSYSQECNVSRWKAFVHYEHEESYQLHLMANIVQQLSKEYKTRDQILQFLIELEIYMYTNDWKPNTFLQLWINKEKELFLDLWEKTAKEIPDRFRISIENTLAKNNSSFINKLNVFYLSRISRSSSTSIGYYLQILIEYTPEQYPLSFSKVTRIANKDNLNMLTYSLWRYQMKTQDSSSCINLLTPLLKRFNFISDRSFIHLANIIRSIKKDNPNYTFPKKFVFRVREITILYPYAKYELSSIINELYKDFDNKVFIIKKRLELQIHLDSIEYPTYYNKRKSQLLRLTKYINKGKLFILFPKTIFILNKLKKYDAISIDFVDQLSLTIKTYTDYSNYIHMLLNIKIKKGFSSHDIQKLVSKSILEGMTQKLPWLNLLFTDALKNNQLQMQEFILNSIPHNSIPANIFAPLIDSYFIQSNALNKKEKIQSLLQNKIFARGFSSTIGEVPKELIIQKEYFEDFYKAIKEEPNKSIVKQILHLIEQQELSHIEEDEAILYER